MELTFEIPSDRFSQPQSSSAGPSQIGKELFHQALLEPVEYPPLNQIVFPGDSVAFVVQDDLHSEKAAAEGLLNCLPQILTESSVFFVLPKAGVFTKEEVDDWTKRFADLNLSLSFEVHDPEDKNGSAYIAVNKDGDPLYVNRVIFDCDVVVPIRQRTRDVSTVASFYPRYSNLENRERLRSATPKTVNAEVRLVEESLGIHFVVEVETNPGGDLLQVVAGEREKVVRTETKAMVNGWEVDQLADGKVVLATIESPNPTWEQFFDALINSSMSTQNNDRIIIASDIENSPSDIERTILQLQFETDHERIESLFAELPVRFKAIPGILEDKSVYLKSKLDESEIEELGLGYIESEDQIQRVLDQAESGVLLRDAHRCQILNAERI